MPVGKGFAQINFQVPQQTFDKLEEECKRLGMKKTEFMTRMLVIYFMSKEMGIAKDVFDFMIKSK